jgi:hypothetical protein
MRTLSVSLLAAAMLTLCGRDAAAQQPRPERPYRGLFGGGVDDASRLLTLTTAIGSGYDSNVLLGTDSFAGGSGDPRLGVSSPYGSLNTSLNFALNHRRLSIESSVASLLRYYSQLNDQFIPAHSAYVRIAGEPWRNGRLSAAQTVSLQPYLSLFVLPGLSSDTPVNAPPQGADFGVGSADSVSLASSIDWTQRLSRRLTLTIGYSRQGTTFAKSSSFGDFSSQLGSARLSYGLTRGLTARIGYGYQDARYGAFGAGDFQGHNADVGVDFNRALSLSRRTTLTFTTGSTANVYQKVTYYRLLGSARLAREFGRSWWAAAAYNRSVDLQPAYTRPVLGDAATIGVSGLISRRLQVASSVGAFFGNVGFSGTGTGFETYSGTAAVTLALSRHLGVNAGYAYYRYRFDEGALPLPFGTLPLRSVRQSIQASLVLWMPLSYRARPTDATR